MLFVCDSYYCPWGFLAFLMLLIIAIIILTRRFNVSVNQSNNNNTPANPPPPSPPPNPGWSFGEVFLFTVFILFLSSLTLWVFCTLATIQVNKVFIYDTKREYSQNVKRLVKREHLEDFDALLMVEKQRCGPRLSKEDIENIVGNKPDIFSAYTLWRRHKELMRSSSRVIYPDERKIMIAIYDLTWARYETETVISYRYWICKKLVVFTNPILAFFALSC